MIDWTLWNLLVVAVIGTCAWRFFGVIIAGQIDEKSPLFEWIGCVAYAIAAGLMAKILLLGKNLLPPVFAGPLYDFAQTRFPLEFAFTTHAIFDHPA